MARTRNKASAAGTPCKTYWRSKWIDKSSLMKRLAAAAAEAGKEVVLSPCSSDPASLDAVILPKEKKIILDGTAPHVVEPKYPGVCERIVNLGDCWVDEAFRGREAAIINLCRENQALHARASRYMTAAGQLAADSYRIAAACSDLDKAAKFASSLAGRMIPKADRPDRQGREWVRYLSGITPLGVVFYRSTIAKTCPRTVIFSDEFGAISNAAMAAIRETALRRGQEIVTCRNLLLPDTIDHVLLPDLGLAFCTEGRYTHLDSPARRIHARRFTDMAALHDKKQRLTFHRKMLKELLEAAGETLAMAKAVHDDIEAYYKEAMDFDRVNDVTSRLLEDWLA